MSRSKFKGPVVNSGHNLKKKNLQFLKNNTILPEFVGKIFHIYNGKILKSIKIEEPMVGLKFGQLVFTRKFLKHKIK